MANKVEKSNEIEKSENPQKVGEEIEVSNPIIYYSDQPGAGPEDVEPEEEAEPKGKAIGSPPQNKAQQGPKGTK